MKSFLSGMPELKLGLNDKLMFEGTYIYIHYVLRHIYLVRGIIRIHLYVYTCLFTYILSGMPELKLGLNDKLMFEGMTMIYYRCFSFALFLYN
jgi:hypothetical protein